ncbi:hypothetical protein AUJ14_04200 [Candidatus Micrarchaeota archaeon CG1_02_55_22]|nr:MAG: hypothetical protein AUJ14_04200 [Candidatus Micrarchaeota archaeon CG1_02_55_22]
MQSEIPFSQINYAALALSVAITNALAMGVLLGVLAIGLSNALLGAAAGLVTFGVFFISFLTVLYYPRIIARKRARELERNLIPAIQQLLIEIKSGVTLFNAMASVSQDYGEVSKEFKKIVVKMNSGIHELDALSEVTEANPSKSFRKALWQISNALKVGSNLSGVLENQVTVLTRERIDQIRRYGQELSPWTMMYMMAAVIMPSIGVAMLIVIMGFLSFSLPRVVLAALWIFLAVFQLFFMNLVASRRPAI